MEAARIALRTAVNDLETAGGLRLVRWVLFSEADLRAYEKARREVAA